VTVYAAAAGHADVEGQVPQSVAEGEQRRHRGLGAGLRGGREGRLGGRQRGGEGLHVAQRDSPKRLPRVGQEPPHVAAGGALRVGAAPGRPPQGSGGAAGGVVGGGAAGRRAPATEGTA